MDLITSQEMKYIDKLTQASVPSLTLMEKAGQKMSELILKEYDFKKVLILCGSKGNGGDGLVVGRYLLEANKVVDVYFSNTNFSLECLENSHRFKGNIVNSLDKITSYDLIVDALIGVGLTSSLKEDVKNIINTANESNLPIVSLDIPSGIDATTGISRGAFIKSDLCITVQYAKTGLFLEDGLDSYKRLKVINIGIKPSKNIVHLLEKNDFNNFYFTRSRHSNKSTFAHASIIASSKDYPGASLLSYNALSTFMMGVGYAHLYVENSVLSSYQLLHPEIITNAFPSIDGHIKYDENFLNQVMQISSSICIGMGLTISQDAYLTIQYLLKHYNGTLIIDADGLNSIAKYGKGILLSHTGKVILTPHIGEFLKLANLTKDVFYLNSLSIAEQFAKTYNVTLILKSCSTIISDGMNTFISSRGNSGLAKAGSGDTLAGIICGVSAYFKDKNTIDKASLGVFIFGMCAELACQKIEEECLLPQDSVDQINNVIKYLKS